MYGTRWFDSLYYTFNYKGVALSVRGRIIKWPVQLHFYVFFTRSTARLCLKLAFFSNSLKLKYEYRSSCFFLRSADKVGRPFCFCSVSYYLRFPTLVGNLSVFVLSFLLYYSFFSFFLYHLVRSAITLTILDRFYLKFSQYHDSH